MYPEAESTLAPLLALVLAETSEALIAKQSRSSLLAAANGLPPTLNLGFECRLGDDPTVDLHQRLKFDSDDVFRAVTFLKQRAPHQTHPVWERLLTFLENPSSGSLRSIFLEMDSTLFARGAVIPSLFLIFKQGAAALDVVDTLHRHFTGRPLAAGIRTTLETARGCGAEVGGLGLMLAREIETVRLNIQPAPASGPLDLLHALGWRGDSVAVADVYRWAVEAFDTVVLALDVDSRVHPRIGLECAIGTSDPASSRWSAILDRLVADGLCLPAKRDALLDCLKPITPADVPGKWLPSLTAQLLLSPGDRISRFYRAVPHIKLSFSPGQPVSAKAYLGAVHQWVPINTGTGFA